MPGGPGESPAVARRRVRLALRRARAAADPPLSQGEVARRLDWSLSKMQRIEAGDVTISSTDLRALLDFYGGFSAEEIEELIEDARISRRQRWWTKPEYREYLTEATLKLMGFESEAAEIRTFQPGLVPALLQTPEATDQILDFWKASPEKRRVRHDVRVLRRREVFDREDPPRFYLVLDQSVLLRDLGGPKVAAGQMEALVEAAQLPSVRIRVLPMGNGGLVTSLGAFSIVDLNEHEGRDPGEEDEDDAVVYYERGVDDGTTDNPKHVRDYRQNFEDLWKQSFDEEVSLRLITARAAVLRSELDRLDS